MKWKNLKMILEKQKKLLSKKKILLVLAILSITAVSCASKKVQTDLKVCILDLDKQTSTCGGGALMKQNLPNTMLNGYVCMSPDDFDFYVSACEETKLNYKSCLDR